MAQYPLNLMTQCDGTLKEVRLVTTCDSGCKVMACEKCGAETDSHRKTYGCTRPDAS